MENTLNGGKSQFSLAELMTALEDTEGGQRPVETTPVEKIKIDVERGHFVAVRVDVEGEGSAQRIFFTTNLDEVIEAGEAHPIRVETDTDTMEPAPYVTVRGRLEASLNRPVFYELVENAVERDTPEGKQLGIWADGQFFPLGPAGAHEI